MNRWELANLAREYLEQGRAYHRAERTGDAIEAYRFSLALLPSAEAHTALGQVLCTLGRHDEAAEQCHTAIALDPDFGDAYVQMGVLSINLEQWEEAEGWLHLALSAPICSQKAEAHFNLGHVLEHDGRDEAALASYGAALDEQPDFREAEWARLALLARMN